RRPPKDSDVTVLNEEIRLARAEEKLVFGKTGFDWRWGAPDLALDRVLWPIARSTAELLTQDGLSRLRQCGGKECGWICPDTGRDSKRGYFAMRDSGNLSKVRRSRHQLSAA